MDATLTKKANDLAKEFAGQPTTLEELNEVLRALMKTALERMLNTELDAHLGRVSSTGIQPPDEIVAATGTDSATDASGDFWPELGAPLAVPQLFELAIDCDFADAPNLEVRGNDDVFQHKLRSIEAYRSQLQIASLVDSIRQDGPYEYLRDVHFRLYSSKKYRPLFAD